MKKILLISLLIACYYSASSQQTELYPTSQRYLFNPYNRDNLDIDSASYWREIYSWGVAWSGGWYVAGSSESRQYELIAKE